MIEIVYQVLGKAGWGLMGWCLRWWWIPRGVVLGWGLLLTVSCLECDIWDQILVWESRLVIGNGGCDWEIGRGVLWSRKGGV